MSREQNLKVAERFREALQRNDWPTANALLAPDATIRISGRSVLSGTFRSNEHLATTYSWVRQELDAAIDVIEVHDVLVSDWHIVLLLHERAHRGDAYLEYGRVMVMHVAAGVVDELWAISLDQEALDQFWA